MTKVNAGKKITGKTATAAAAAHKTAAKAQADSGDSDLSEHDSDNSQLASPPPAKQRFNATPASLASTAVKMRPRTLSRCKLAC